MLFLVFFLMSIYASAAGSQDLGFVCGFGLDREEGATGQSSHVNFSFYQSGTVRPLILFGKLKSPDDPFSLTQLKDRNGNATQSIADLLDPTHVGSLAHYFKEMSYGALTLEDDGVERVWFEVDSTKATDYGTACMPGVIAFAEEVFAAADDTIDFRDYDRDGEDGDGDGVRDGDGVVDLVILYIPIEFKALERCGFEGTVIEDYASAQNRFIRYPTADSVSIEGRVIVVFQRPSFPHLVGVTAHEYGHMMNLPDLYDSHRDAAGIGLWGLMGWGALGWSWNSAEAKFSGPNPLSVWSRVQVGWITEDNGRLETVESDTEDATTLHDIHSQSSAVKAYKIPIRSSETEYFLMANRQNAYDGAPSSVGYYDGSAPASGLAIWHIDDGLSSGSNDLRYEGRNNHEEHKRVDLECADGLFFDQGYPSNNLDSVAGGDNLDYVSSAQDYRSYPSNNPNPNNGNPGDATDLWDGSTQRQKFTPSSNPSTAGYDDQGTTMLTETMPNPYADDTQDVFSGIAVRDISQTNGVMSFKVHFIPSAPGLAVTAHEGTTLVTLGWVTPTVNATAITEYQYSIDKTNWTSVDGGASASSVSFDNSTSTTFYVRAVTANEKGETAKVVLDRPGTVVLEPSEALTTSPSVGDQLTATLTDANGGLSGQRWQWERGTVSDDVWTGTSIANATDDEYLLMVDDVGYQVRATVSYMDGAGDNKDMAASVPTALVVGGLELSGPDEETVAEVVLPATAPRAVATYTTTASEGTTVSWSLAGPDQAAFTLSAAGVLSFAAGPDYEAPTDSGHATDADGNNIYHVTVQATAGAQTATAEVQVTVTNADDPGTVSLTPSSPQLGRPVTAHLTDPDGRITGAMWTWQHEGDTPGDWIVVWPLDASDASAGAELSSYTPQAADGGRRLRARVVYQDGASTDGNDPKQATSAPSAAVNRPPVASGPQAVSFAEHTLDWVATYTATDPDGDPLSRWSWAGADSAAFLVDVGAGQVAFAAVPDYEQPTDADGRNTYEVAMITSDGVLADTLAVVVTVVNIEEAGAVALSVSAAPRVGQPITATLTDPDGGITGAVWQWQRRSAATDSWQAVPAEAVGTATDYPALSSYTPPATDVGWMLQATVAYRDGHGQGKTAESAATAPVLSNETNAPPMITAGPSTVSVPENTTAVATYTATDPDDAVLDWSVAGTDAAAFAISSAGVLTFVQAPDFETKATYQVEVVVADGGLSARQAVTVTVTNEDDPGAIALSSAQPIVGQPITATLTDPDGSLAKVQWSWLVKSSGAGGQGEEPLASSGASSETTSTYTPDRRVALRVLARYDDGQGPGKYVFSAITARAWDVPERPQQVAATASAGSVVLTWQAPASDGGTAITHYEVRWRGTGDWTDWTAVAGGGTVRTQTVAGLTDDPAYTLEVRAVNAVGLGAAAEVLFTTDQAGEIALSSLQPQVGQPITATLTDADGGITGAAWQWQRRTADTAPWQPVAAQATGTTDYPELSSYTPQVGDVGFMLQATVGYNDNHGDGKTAASVATKSVPAIVPDAPTVQAVAGAGQVGLTWTEAADGGAAITHYEVRYRGSGDWTDWTAVAGGGDARAQTVKALSNCTAYTLEVRAVNPVGAGPAGDATATPKGVPGAVGSLSAVGGDQQVVLTWTEAPVEACAAITHYEYRSRGAGDWTDWTHVSGGGAARTQTVEGLTNDQAYTLAVRAVNGVGPGSAVEATATPEAVDQPGTIQLSSLQPTVGQSLTATLQDADGNVRNVQWSWSYFTTAASGQIDVEAEASGLTTTLVPRRVLVGRSLQVRVLYDDAHGPNKRAQSAKTQPVIGPPEELAMLEAHAGAEQVVLRWTAPEADGGTAITHYEYRYSADGGTTWAVDWTGVGLATSQTVTALTNGQAYTLEVRAVNAVGPGAASQTTATPQPTHTLQGPTAVAFAENGAGAVATYTAQAPVGTTLGWSLTGTDAAAFRLDGSGRARTLHFVNAPNFEAKATYTVTVGVAEGTQSATVAVTVTVTNIDEPGTVTLSSTQPQVGTAITATLTDEDGQIAVERWAWERFPEPFAAGTSGIASGQYTPAAGEVGHYVRVTVYYRDGHGADKQAQSVQTDPIVDVPGVPSLTAMAGDGQVGLTWTAPASDGGSSITRYEYRYSDDGGTTWSPDWTGVGLATSQTITALTNQTEYTFEVRAVNGVGPSTAAQATATPVASCVIAVAGSTTVSVAENSTGALATYTATATDCGSLTWSLTGADAAAFRLDGSGRARTLHLVNAPDFEAQATYAVTVGVAEDTESATVAVAVTVTNIDEPGTVTLSSTQPQVGTAITATLSDPDGNVTNVRWSWLYFSAGATGQNGEPVAGEASDEFTPSGVLVGIQLQALALYDDGHATNKTARSVKTDPVVDVPDPPLLTAAAGDGQVVLTWTAPASDGGSAITRYEYRHSNGSWTTVSGGASARSQTVEGLTNGQAYTFEVRAVNGVGPSTAAQATATPVAPCSLTVAGSTTASVAENSTGAMGTYTATATDCGSLTWSLTGTDAAAFRLDGSGLSRTLHFVSAPNFETQATYAVTVGVAEGAASATVAVSVTVTNVDEAGSVTLSSTQPQVGTAITATLTDPDGNVQNLRWSWSYFRPGATGQDDEGSEDTEVSGANGLSTSFTPRSLHVGLRLRARALYTDGHGANKRTDSSKTDPVIGPPDAPSLSATGGEKQVTLSWSAPDDNGSSIQYYQYRRSSGSWSTVSGGASARSQTVSSLSDNTTYTFEVRAVNGVGAGAAASASATTTQPNRPPTVTGSSAVSVAEGRTAVADYDATDPDGDAITWSKSGTHASSFSLSTSGTLTFSSAPNFESGPTTYTVTVTATDSGGLSGAKTVTVTVTNVDEAGSVTLSSTQPQVGTAITATLTDPDGNVQNLRWSWSYFRPGATGQDDEGSEDTEVSGANGLSTSFTPKSRHVGLRLRARALYTDGHGANKRTDSSKTDPVIGPPDAPSLSATGGEKQVTLSWSAPDDNGSSIQYYQYRRSSGSWSTVSGGASARSQTVSSLSDNTTYTFEVRAVNGVGAGAAASASATTTQPNRPPTVTGASAVSVAEGRTAVADYDATDPDGDAITWSKSGTHASSFSLSTSGTLTFSSAPNFESGPTTYTVTVTATDSGGLSGAKTVTVTVTNVDEAGSVTLSSTQPQVGTAITATLTDPDGNVRNLRWSWSYFRPGATGQDDEGSEGSEDTEVSGANGLSTSFTPKSRHVGLRLRARALYTDGHGANKRTDSSKTDPVIGPPGQPGNLSAEPGSIYTQVDLSWTAAATNGSSITDYQYRYRRSGNSSWSSWTSMGVVTSYTVSGLQSGASYTFQVRAVNAVGKGTAAQTGARAQAEEEQDEQAPDEAEAAAEGEQDEQAPDEEAPDEEAPDEEAPDEEAPAAKPTAATNPPAVLAVIAAPNPFNPTTTLYVQLPTNAPVRLTIYNIAGQPIRTLLDRTMEPGEHILQWDGRDQQRRPVASGVYLYRLQTTQQILMGKMALIR